MTRRSYMRKSLGLLAALAAFAASLALVAGPAAANHVQCGDLITRDTTLDSDLLCSGTALNIVGQHVTVKLGGHLVQGNLVASNDADASRLVVQDGVVRGVIDVNGYDSSTVKGLTATAIRFFTDQQ